MIENVRTVSALTVSLSVAVALTGCARGPERAAGGVPAGGTAESGASAPAHPRLQLGFRDNVRSLDPAIGYDTYSSAFIHALFLGLVDYDYEEGTKLVPALAERWEESADRRTYTFHLRPGLKFSNGRALAAADFKYAIERVLRPATKSPGADFFRGITGAKAFQDGKAADVGGLRAPDAATFVVQLDAPNPVFIYTMALTFAAPVPKEEVERAGADFQQHPVGTGAFVLREWKPGQSIELARNPNFYRSDRPRVAAVRARMQLEESVQMLQFENGNLDVLATVPAADYPRIKRDPKWQKALLEAPVPTTWYLGMNTQMAPFDRLKVRQAVNHAINRDALLRLLNGRGVKATSILPQKMPGHQPGLDLYPYNPEKARQLLREAGLAGGFTTTFWVISRDDTMRVAEGVQADLETVGIHAQIKPAVLASYLTAIHTANTTPLFHGGWYADFPDPSGFLDPLFNSNQIKPVNSNNSTFYRNPKVDALLDRARSMPLGEARLDLYRQAERLIMQDAPWAPLYDEVETRLVQPGVTGVKIHPMWKYLVLSEIGKG
jgi:oligopeptide transport system substrate-binding protein